MLGLEIANVVLSVLCLIGIGVLLIATALRH